MFAGFDSFLDKQRFYAQFMFQGASHSEPQDGPVYSETRRNGELVAVTLGRKPHAGQVAASAERAASPLAELARAPGRAQGMLNHAGRAPATMANPFALTPEDRAVAQQMGVAEGDMVLGKVREFRAKNAPLASTEGLTPEDVEIARQMGLSREEMRAYKAQARAAGQPV
jgi:hypothetical protein